MKRLLRRARTTPASTTPAARPLAAPEARITDRLLCTALGQHGDPVFDDFRRFPVNLHPGERLAEDVAVRERALRPHAGGQVAEPSLESENLSQTLEIAARQRQTSEPGQWFSSSSIIVTAQ